MEKYILTFVRGSGSVWVHLSTILRVQVHCSKILLLQVRFGFTKMKRFIRVYGSGSGSVRHPVKYTFAPTRDCKSCSQARQLNSHIFVTSTRKFFLFLSRAIQPTGLQSLQSQKTFFLQQTKSNRALFAPRIVATVQMVALLCKLSRLSVKKEMIKKH